MLQKAIRKGVALLLFSVLITGMCFSVNAQSTRQDSSKLSEPVQLRWTNIASIITCLSFSNGKGTLSGEVIGHPGTTQITAYATLKRQNIDNTYTTVASWNDLSTNSDLLIFSQTYYVSRGYTYKLTLTGTVYRNGTSETASCSTIVYAN
jgi:hypothetical protein